MPSETEIEQHFSGSYFRDGWINMTIFLHQKHWWSSAENLFLDGRLLLLEKILNQNIKKKFRLSSLNVGQKSVEEPMDLNPKPQSHPEAESQNLYEAA